MREVNIMSFPTTHNIDTGFLGVDKVKLIIKQMLLEFSDSEGGEYADIIFSSKGNAYKWIYSAFLEDIEIEEDEENGEFIEPTILLDRFELFMDKDLNIQSDEFVIMSYDYSSSRLVRLCNLSYGIE